MHAYQVSTSGLSGSPGLLRGSATTLNPSQASPVASSISSAWHGGTKNPQASVFVLLQTFTSTTVVQQEKETCVPYQCREAAPKASVFVLLHSSKASKLGIQMCLQQLTPALLELVCVVYFSAQAVLVFLY